MQSEYLIHALCLACGLACHIVALLLLARMSNAVFRNILLAFSSGLIVLALSQTATFFLFRLNVADFLAMAILNLALYGILAFLVCHFLLLGLCSLRLRILEVLDEYPEGLTGEALCEALGVEELTQRRLDRLQASGAVKNNNDHIQLGRSYLILISHTILFLRRYIGKCC